MLKPPIASGNFAGMHGRYAAGAIEPQLTQKHAGATLKILVVACPPELREQLKSRLPAMQWTLREARGGAEALELLLEESSDLMLVSDYLPDLEVGEFQRLVRRQFPQVQIISLGAEVAQKQSGVNGPAGLAKNSHTCFEPTRSCSHHPLVRHQPGVCGSLLQTSTVGKGWLGLDRPCRPCTGQPAWWRGETQPC